MKPSVKSALMIVLSYFLLSLISTLVCALLAMVYTICTHAVSGQIITAFDSVIFIEGLLSSAPLVLMVSTVFMILYLVRHPVVHWLPLTVYAALCILSWLVFIPGLFALEEHFDQQGIMSEVEYSHISADYFRQNGNLVVFYSNVEHGNLADGVCIDLNSSYNTMYSFSNLRLPNSEGGFVDSLVQSSVGMPLIVSVIMGAISDFVNSSRLYMLRGFLSWIVFASLGLALMSVIGLRRVSRWRLVNLAFVVLATVCIFVFNTMSLVPSVLTEMESFMNGFLVKVFPLQNPFLFLSNIVIALALGLTGLLIDLINRPEEDYVPGGSL